MRGVREGEAMVGKGESRRRAASWPRSAPWRRKRPLRPGTVGPLRSPLRRSSPFLRSGRALSSTHKEGNGGCPMRGDCFKGCQEQGCRRWRQEVALDGRWPPAPHHARLYCRQRRALGPAVSQTWTQTDSEHAYQPLFASCRSRRSALPPPWASLRRCFRSSAWSRRRPRKRRRTSAPSPVSVHTASESGKRRDAGQRAAEGTHLQVVDLPRAHADERERLEDGPVLDARVGRLGRWWGEVQRGRERSVSGVCLARRGLVAQSASGEGRTVAVHALADDDVLLLVLDCVPREGEETQAQVSKGTFVRGARTPQALGGSRGRTVLEAVGERADLLLYGRRLAVVWDVDDAVDVEPASPGR